MVTLRKFLLNFRLKFEDKKTYIIQRKFLNAPFGSQYRQRTLYTDLLWFQNLDKSTRITKISKLFCRFLFSECFQFLWLPDILDPRKQLPRRATVKVVSRHSRLFGSFNNPSKRVKNKIWKPLKVLLNLINTDYGLQRVNLSDSSENFKFIFRHYHSHSP